MRATLFSCRATAAAAALTVLALPLANAPAQADETTGPYVVLGAAQVWRAPAAENPATYTDFESGVAYNAAIGYKFKKYIGADVEYTHVLNWSQTVAAAVTGPAPGLGNVTLDFTMANLRFDLPIGEAYTPYFSVGAGGYRSHVNGDTNTIANSFGFAAYGANTGETLAYQVRAGVAFPILNHVHLLVGYRFMRGGNLTFKNTAFGTLNPNGATLQQLEVGAKIGN